MILLLFIGWHCMHTEQIRTTLQKQRWAEPTSLSALSHQLPIWCAVEVKMVGSTHLCFYSEMLCIPASCMRACMHHHKNGIVIMTDSLLFQIQMSDHYYSIEESRAMQMKYFLSFLANFPSILIPFSNWQLTVSYQVSSLFCNPHNKYNFLFTVCHTYNSMPCMYVWGWAA